MIHPASTTRRTAGDRLTRVQRIALTVIETRPAAPGVKDATIEALQRRGLVRFDQDHDANGYATSFPRWYLTATGRAALPELVTPPEPARTYTDLARITTGIARGWADRETDPRRIDWSGRQSRAAMPFRVVDGRPCNPAEPTTVRHGRNQLGRWGENLMADALVVATIGGVRHLLMVERGDGYGWAVPGGKVDRAETGGQAAARELAEETGLTVPVAAGRARTPRYVPDPRGSYEAWAVTVPVVIDLGERGELPAVAGADDARRAAWLPATSYQTLTAALTATYGGAVFAAHVDMVRQFLPTR